MFIKIRKQQLMVAGFSEKPMPYDVAEYLLKDTLTGLFHQDIEITPQLLNEHGGVLFTAFWYEEHSVPCQYTFLDEKNNVLFETEEPHEKILKEIELESHGVDYKINEKMVCKLFDSSYRRQSFAHSLCKN